MQIVEDEKLCDDCGGVLLFDGKKKHGYNIYRCLSCNKCEAIKEEADAVPDVPRKESQSSP